ncbi:MAG: GldM family protein [Bacteroidota bacterium]
MMYLVLLALLALNVSREILDAFSTLREKLATTSVNSSEDINRYVAGMNEKINDEITNENKLINKGLLDTIPAVQGEAGKIIELIEGYVVKMEEIAKKDPQTQKLQSIDETEKNLQYWMGEGAAQESNPFQISGSTVYHGGGEAYKLRQELEKYYNYIVDMYNSQIGRSPKDSAATPLKINDLPFPADQGSGQGSNDETAKSWEKKTFDGPVIANLAQLEALKMDVFDAEQKLLEKFGERLGLAKFKIDKFTPVIAAESEIVPAGLQYRARLYLIASSSQLKPNFTGNGVKTDETGDFGVLTLPASGSVIPRGKKEGTQSFKANISMKTTSGSVESYPIEGTFKVRKPEVVVNSAAIQILYQECGNDVNIDVPALGDQYNPKIAIDKGRVITNSKSRTKFRLVPTGRTAKVTVSSVTNGQTVKIDDVNYKVIKPPKPTIDMRVNGKKVTGAPVSKTSRVQVKLDADPDFKSSLPQDARYGIQGVEVKAQLSLGPPVTVNRINTAGKDATKAISVAMGTRVRQARAGTTVYIVLNDIYRVNFQNKRIVDRRFSEVERTLSLVVK